MSRSAAVLQAARNGASAIVPLGVLSSVTRTKLLIPYYHVVSDEPNACVTNLYRFKSVAQFREDLDFLASRYTPVGMRDLIRSVAGGRPFLKKTFCLTFDDGFREMYDVVAPILLEKGIPAAFFVNSAFVDNKELGFQHQASILVAEFESRSSERLRLRVLEALGHGPDSTSVRSAILSVPYADRQRLEGVARVLEFDASAYLSRNRPYMTAAQIRDLIRQGFAIGGHSVDHPLYANLTLDEQLDQTVRSMRYVRETFNLDYGAFAFPHKDSNVSVEFFDRLRRTETVHITFGTAGVLRDCVPGHLQRFSLEKPIERAERIIAWQHLRKAWRVATMRGVIRRRQAPAPIQGHA